MAKKLKVLVVCGFGIGSSLLLKMNIDKVLKENGIPADVETCDMGSAAATPCDIVFTSAELGDKLRAKLQVPVVVIDNFTKLDQIRERGLDAIAKLSGREKP